MQRVLIVGGGPAGLALALSLAAREVEVVVVERSNYRNWRVGEHLTPEGRALLSGLGVPDASNNGVHRRCDGVRSAWGDDAVDRRDYLFHPFGYGLNLSRPAFEVELVADARHRGVQIMAETEIAKCRRTKVAWEVALKADLGTRLFTVDFIVDATGRTASFARAQGGKVIAFDRLIAIVAFLTADEAITAGLEDTILLEAAEEGWWYVANLSQRRSVCMYVTDTDLMCSGPEAHLQTWQTRVRNTRHVFSLVKSIPTLRRIVVRSARTQILNKVAGPGWMAIGDAAMAFDPLSSNGIAKGFRYAPISAEIIVNYMNGQPDALDFYGHTVNQEFLKYMNTRTSYYLAEQRWATSPFWQRRHEHLRPLSESVPVR